MVPPVMTQLETPAQNATVVCQVYVVPAIVRVSPKGGTLCTVTVPLAYVVNELAVSVTDPMVTVAPGTAVFAVMVPTELAVVVAPSVVDPAPVVHTGVVAPLVAPAIRHPPPVHCWTCPFVSTT